MNGIEKVIRMLILPRRNFVSSPALNPLSPNIHTQIPYTDLHTFYERISGGFDKDQSIFPLVISSSILINFSLNSV